MVAITARSPKLFYLQARRDIEIHKQRAGKVVEPSALARESLARVIKQEDVFYATISLKKRMICFKKQRTGSNQGNGSIKRAQSK